MSARQRGTPTRLSLSQSNRNENCRVILKFTCATYAYCIHYCSRGRLLRRFATDDRYRGRIQNTSDNIQVVCRNTFSSCRTVSTVVSVTSAGCFVIIQSLSVRTDHGDTYEVRGSCPRSNLLVVSSIAPCEYAIRYVSSSVRSGNSSAHPSFCAYQSSLYVAAVVSTPTKEATAAASRSSSAAAQYGSL